MSDCSFVQPSAERTSTPDARGLVLGETPLPGAPPSRPATVQGPGSDVFALLSPADRDRILQDKERAAGARREELKKMSAPIMNRFTSAGQEFSSIKNEDKAVGTFLFWVVYRILMSLSAQVKVEVEAPSLEVAQRSFGTKVEALSSFLTTCF